VGGTGGQSSGLWGIMVELEDGAAAPDEDPRRPAMRSSSAAVNPNIALGFAWDCCNLWKARSEWQARVLGGTDGISPTWMRRRQLGDSRSRSDRPCQNGVIAFGRCMASTCPAPSDRWAWRRPQCH
jgi:hypothetical protein